MLIGMERLPVQSKAWRISAVLIAALLGLLGINSAIFGLAHPIGWAKAVYWLLAPLGLIGLAFGFRPIGKTFWRFYAVIFTIEVTLRTARVLLGSSSHPLWTNILFSAVIALICIALFKYAAIRSEKNDLAEVFR